MLDGVLTCWQDAVEERILDRATQKLKLDQLVIQEGRAQTGAKGELHAASGVAVNSRPDQSGRTGMSYWT